jgi:hypothetical protein
MGTTETFDTQAVELPNISWTPQQWREHAACKGQDIEIFFSSNGVNTGGAKKVCHGCPVMLECLQWACNSRISHGVYGGRSPRERLYYQKGVDDWRICGTPAGIAAHKERGDEECPACTAARIDIARRAVTRKKYAMARAAANQDEESDLD